MYVLNLIKCVLFSIRGERNGNVLMKYIMYNVYVWLYFLNIIFLYMYLSYLNIYFYLCCKYMVFDVCKKSVFV